MLTAEIIQQNWINFLHHIDNSISSPRKEKLLEFYQKYADRFIIMPASSKSQYHNCFPGGYIDHVIRVIECSLKLYNIWEEMGADVTTFTKEELIFSALNHDLGKFGTLEEDAYIVQTDQWRREKLNEQYKFNDHLEYMSVPDRSLQLLMSLNIPFSKNEMLAIKLHDGLYDESNKSYLQNFMPETKPRTSLFYILHHADMMASRIEFEKEWFPKFKNGQNKEKQKNTNHSIDTSNFISIKQSKINSKKNKSLEEVLGNNSALVDFFKK